MGSASNKNQDPHPDPHQSDKSDPDPHQRNADPQHCFLTIFVSCFLVFIKKAYNYFPFYFKKHH